MGKPLSNAERKRKYRERLSNDKREEIKKANRERKALKRATKKLTMDQLTKRRERNREQQRKHRESKKMNKPIIINMPFKSRQSKARAITKARRALPSTPKKTREVVKELFKSLTPSSQKRIRNPQNNNSTNALSKETVNLMKAFYEDDANFRVLPGKKDVLSSKDESNNKVKMTKQLLLDDTDNLYSKFIDSYPTHKIGRSKFFSLRPNWVLSVQAQSQEVCKCIYHEKIHLVCTVLANFSRSKQI